MQHASILWRVGAPLCCALFAGCAGFGIVASTDPLTKLEDAQVLFEKENRPLPAEKLTQEAIAIYKQRDDAHGLGNAYREYGDFLQSPAVTAWNSSYGRLGNFHDDTISAGDRQTVVAELYRKALTYYERAETEYKAAQQYDALTNIYVNMAWSHLKLGEVTAACAAYDRTVEAYQENMRLNPSAKPNVGRFPGTLPDAVAAMKQRAGC